MKLFALSNMRISFANLAFIYIDCGLAATLTLYFHKEVLVEKCYYILCIPPFLSYSTEQNFCRLFHVLAQFPFTTSETELDYYHQKVTVPVTSQIAERFKT